MNKIHELFWNASLEDLQRGFIYCPDQKNFICLVCGEEFEHGMIYPFEGKLYTAQRYAEIHVDHKHEGMLHYLLSLDKKFTGVTHHQKQLIHFFSQGLSDTIIAKEMGDISPSTVRNHRFSLREKAKQAKLFLAMMNMIEQQTDQKQRYVTMHRTAKMIDERYAITEKEREEVISRYLPEGIHGKVKEFPRKEKRKLIILSEIIQRFQRDHKYTEKEVNEILKTAFDDFVTLRRYMIEYGFMGREQDGSYYWVKG